MEVKQKNMEKDIPRRLEETKEKIEQTKINIK